MDKTANTTCKVWKNKIKYETGGASGPEFTSGL